MRTKFVLSLSILFIVVLSGCSTTKANIFARDNGTYFVVASSSDSLKAKDAAFHAAQTYCKKIGKRFISMKNNSNWNEASNERMPDTVLSHDKQDGELMKNVDATNPPMTTLDTTVWKITVDFRCI